MEQYPIHFDGSVQSSLSAITEEPNEPFQVTDEMRKYISANPYAPTVTE